MYKEVAFDPECLADMSYYRLLKQHFGYDNGRYVAALKAEWIKEAMTVVKSSALGEVKKKSIKNFLNALSRKKVDSIILPPDRSSERSNIWLDWVNAQEKNRQFSFTVTERTLNNKISIDDIDNDIECWQIPRSVSVEREASAILNAIKPLLLISKVATLIDPYFRLTSNNTLLALLSDHDLAHIKKITIITALDSSNAASTYSAEYKNLNKHNIAIKWLKAPDKFFHARYIITDIGAVRSDPGFMEQPERNANSDLAPMNIISKQEAMRALADVDRLVQEEKAKLLFGFNLEEGVYS